MDTQLASFASVRQLEILEAIEAANGSIRGAARALKLDPKTVRHHLDRLKVTAASKGYSPEHGLTHTAAPGFAVKRISTAYSPDGIPLQWVIQEPDKEARQAAQEAAYEAMAQELPRVAPRAYTGHSRADLCNLYTFTDYHLGMLAWGVECGADWDLKIAEAALWASFEKMVIAAPDADTAVLNIQGDFLHSDGLLPVTPAHKHVLDQDGRFSKIVSAAIRILRRLIDHALTKHKAVHLLIVEGNHDEASSVWLRQMFAALYDQEPRLTVNDSELPYYVFRHGDVMLAFHHGHKVKNEQLPGLFAAQFSRMWGETTKRYCHTGHRHHLDEKEYSGMIVTQHPTLSARDAYAARGGWIAERAALAITYHKTAGQYGRTYISPETP
jgi:hypothetical protein